jgi:probable phosphoglycerate mutase
MQGGGEYPLSAFGKKQAATAHRTLAGWPLTLVAASDLSRAQDTALLAARRLDIVDARLRERDAGVWEGRPRAELEAQHPGALENDHLRPAVFEPTSDVVARMRAACDDLTSHDGLVVAFTHGAVLRELARELGDRGDRFAHLEGLCLGEDLTVLGRIGPLHERPRT